MLVIKLLNGIYAHEWKRRRGRTTKIVFGDFGLKLLVMRAFIPTVIPQLTLAPATTEFILDFEHTRGNFYGSYAADDDDEHQANHILNSG